MYHFKYVSKKEAAPYKTQLIELLNRVQDYVRGEFTFQFTFIGSSSRNMITYDPMANVGFDFDVNIAVNDDNEDYSPEDMRTILHEAFSHFMRDYGYTKCEQSTRVISMKTVDPWHSRITHSCDFAESSSTPYPFGNSSSKPPGGSQETYSTATPSRMSAVQFGWHCAGAMSRYPTNL